MDAVKGVAWPWMGYLRWLRLHHSRKLKVKCDPRVRRGIPKGGRRQPPFGCHRQRDITSNRGF